MNHTLDDPSAVKASIRDLLTRGATSRKSPMHTPVVGTADGDLRVMVLREYDDARHILRFHTDARSPKVAAIEADAPVGVLAYDAQAKIQIRMRGRGRVERDTPIADAKWTESTNFARRCYLAEAGPSSVAAKPVSGLPDWAEGIQPTEGQVAPARPN
ncbi:MAG: pyridoxamine 5'-phosphate oxidase family protein, partial [Pontixanthobacter sp.]